MDQDIYVTIKIWSESNKIFTWQLRFLRDTKDFYVTINQYLVRIVQDFYVTNNQDFISIYQDFYLTINQYLVRIYQDLYATINQDLLRIYQDHREKVTFRVSNGN